MRRFKDEHEQPSSNTEQLTQTQMMIAAGSLVEEEINCNKEMILMNAMAMQQYSTGEDNSCKRE